MTVFTAGSTYDELIEDAGRSELGAPARNLIIDAAHEARKKMREKPGPDMDYVFMNPEGYLKKMIRYTTGIMTCIQVSLLAEGRLDSEVEREARKWTNDWAVSKL